MARARGRRQRLRARVAVLLGLLLVLTACPAPPSEDGASSPSRNEGSAGGPTGDGAGPGRQQLTIAVVGDSITVGSDPTFAPGQVSEDSWVRYAVGDPVELTGGWARWGATTAEMAAAVEPVPADVLVIMAGTNDLAAGTPTAQVAQNLEDIVATVGAQDVLLCAVPPLDARPDVVPPFNEFLERTAEDRGWAWVDPAAEIRSEGHFAPGMSVDGVHPTQAGATQLGVHVRSELLSGFGHSG
ncbi:SGNH/GDSL hydrolase family protein [Ruania albidiflava]|uniref:SGNH/GDSL hydrolase family protein n=1 Tax=Ruania albidiflava TaxID=366586 RepID=UPI0003B4AEA3|nr:SGNH/GDSL hydrolase family protein [Ruania albidiflava]